MTDSTIVAILTALPPTLAAIAALIQGLKNSKKADAANIKADVANEKTNDLLNKTAIVTEKAEAIATKTDEIHTLANSNFSKVSANNQVLAEKVAGLEKLITTLTEQKNAAALAVAYATPPPGTARLPEAPITETKPIIAAPKEGPGAQVTLSAPVLMGAIDSLAASVAEGLTKVAPIPVKIVDKEEPNKKD